MLNLLVPLFVFVANIRVWYAYHMQLIRDAILNLDISHQKWFIFLLIYLSYLYSLYRNTWPRGIMILSMKCIILNRFISNNIWSVTKTFLYIKFSTSTVVTKISRVFIILSEGDLAPSSSAIDEFFNMVTFSFQCIVVICVKWGEIGLQMPKIVHLLISYRNGIIFSSTPNMLM